MESDDNGITLLRESMDSIEGYRRHLGREQDWHTFLLERSGLPERSINTELALAVAEEGDRVLFGTLTSANNEAPANSPQEFLVFCGIVGLGRLIADGDETLIPTLRTFAKGRNGRLLDAVELALELIAERNPRLFLLIGHDWAGEPHVDVLWPAIERKMSHRS